MSERDLPAYAALRYGVVRLRAAQASDLGLLPSAGPRELHLLGQEPARAARESPSRRAMSIRPIVHFCAVVFFATLYLPTTTTSASPLVTSLFGV